MKQGGRPCEGAMAALKGFTVDVGARGRDELELPIPELLLVADFEEEF